MNRLTVTLPGVLALAGALFFSQGVALAQNCSGQPAANTVCAGPTSGGNGLPGWRALVSADVPLPLLLNQNASALNTGGLAATPIIHGAGADGTQPAIVFDAYQGGIGGNFAPFINLRSAQGTGALPTAMSSGNEIGVFLATGYNGSAFTSSENGSLVFAACENWTVAHNCTEAILKVTPVGTNAASQGLFLDPSVANKLTASFGQNGAGGMTATECLRGITSGAACIAAQDAAGSFTYTLGSGGVNSTLTFGGNFTTSAGLTTTGTGAPTLAFPSSSFTYTFQGSSDTIVGRATTDTLTNKTFDTAGTGNVFKINGTSVSAVTGTGSAVLATSPTLVTPTLGVASATNITVANGATNGIILTAASGTNGSVAMGAGGSVIFTLGSTADGFVVHDHGSANMLLVQEATPGTIGTTTTQFAGALVASGSVPTPSGTCSVNTQTGGNTAGTFKANGGCAGGTVILTFSATAPTGYVCDAHDQTTPADLMNQTANSTTSVTLTGTMANLDVVAFKCMAF